MTHASAEAVRSTRSVMGRDLLIIVGSTNKAKVEAVREILCDYPHLAHAEVRSAHASSDVSDQPKSLEETITGAMNRARGVYGDADYSIGIE